MNRDVVITGLGATTPLGGDVASTWAGLVGGRSGVSALEDEALEVYGVPVRIGARLAVEPSALLARVEARRMDRCGQVAVISAREAWEDSGLGEDGVDRERLGVVVGTGNGGILTLLEQDDMLERTGARKVSPLTIPMLMCNGPAAQVGLNLEAKAGVHTPISACASGAEALAWAFKMIKTGEAEVVVAGGAEACIHPLILAGFSQARAMSVRNDDPESASRPFDASRDGFVLGEGAGMMVLESETFARARGARIHGRLAGAGMSSDGYHITAVHPEGDGQVRALKEALHVADVEKSAVDHVNCHATSTPGGDVIEAKAIHKAIGDHPVLTAPKSSIGHLLGAAGAVEGIATVLSIREGIVPATLNLVDPDPGLKLDVVADAPRKLTLRAAVSESLGFGGHNVALVFTSV